MNNYFAVNPSRYIFNPQFVATCLGFMSFKKVEFVSLDIIEIDGLRKTVPGCKITLFPTLGCLNEKVINLLQSPG